MKYQAITEARIAAKEYENRLDERSRKLYGRYFTGLPLSKLLSVIALERGCKLVIDPMAGHGDLLDSTLELAYLQSTKLKTVHGIEIDTETAYVCKNRLKPWLDLGVSDTITVFENDAFNPILARSLESNGYDLAITNPPFVRYQITSGNQNSLDPKRIREALLEIAADRIPTEEISIWSTLIRSYSGLADLSIPSWLLASMLVCPGGTLALVAPATWETRKYADIIKYLLFRCFDIETILTDTPPGWFPGALVRTQLIIAKRLKQNEALIPVSKRNLQNKRLSRIEISPKATNEESIVGNLFPGPDSDFQFAEWLSNIKKANQAISNEFIEVRHVPIIDEIERWEEIINSSPWYSKMEPSEHETIGSIRTRSTIPERLNSILPYCADKNLKTIEQSNIRIGQGLRTGCNDFFYVTAIQKNDEEFVRVRLSSLFHNKEINIPKSAVAPVIRHQADLGLIKNGNDNLKGLVLDLRNYVLPEDYESVKAAKESYGKAGKSIVSIMPNELSEYVRKASKTIYIKSKINKPIPGLSAVRPNTRKYDPKRPSLPPRFWYMLPDFTRRHRPEAFVPRVNHGTPWTYVNSHPSTLIDANFSTIWQIGKGFAPSAIAALMNSTWCRVYMESIGTPLGGGALKLEATHLRQIRIPIFNLNELDSLDLLGNKLKGRADMVCEQTLKQIDYLVITAILRDSSNAIIEEVTYKFNALVSELCIGRQKK